MDWNVLRLSLGYWYRTIHLHPHTPFTKYSQLCNWPCSEQWNNTSKWGNSMIHVCLCLHVCVHDRVFDRLSSPWVCCGSEVLNLWPVITLLLCSQISPEQVGCRPFNYFTSVPLTCQPKPSWWPGNRLFHSHSFQTKCIAQVNNRIC